MACLAASATTASTPASEEQYTSTTATEQEVEQASKMELLSLKSLYSQLDDLWAHYLDLLDAYTRAQAAIQKHMSSGFFTLAQANFKSTHGRYGQDYYDERAVAPTRVAINAKDDGFCVHIRRIDASADQQTDEEATNTKDRAKEKSGGPSTNAPVSTEHQSSPMQQPTPEATPEPETKKDKTDNSSPESADTDDRPSHADEPQEEEKVPKIDHRDPIRWFGILVPPTLRQAQKSFTTAVLDHDAMTKAVHTSRQLRDVEMEIRKLRKAIRKGEKTVKDDLPIQKEAEAASLDAGDSSLSASVS